MPAQIFRKTFETGPSRFCLSLQARMRSLPLGLIGLSAAARAASSICSTTVVITQTASASASPSSTTTITVATDGSGDFTKIGDAISQAQSDQIPTISVLEGTYPAVTVSETPAATILGETDSEYDYSRNKVVISNDGAALTIAADVDGLSFKNINFVNTASSGEAVSLQGTQNGFYSCQFISAGEVTISAERGLGVLANSYIAASGTIISGAADLFIFNTDIVPTADGTVIAYNEGTISDGTLYNSTIVFDQSSISSQAGDDIAKVYLAAASGPGSVVVFRSSSLGSLIAATGVRIDDTTQDDRNLYGEYDNTGAGAYADNADIRLPYVTLLGSSGLSPYTLRAVLANGSPDYATSDTSWIDPGVRAAIESADVVSPATTGLGDGEDGNGPGDGKDGADTGSASGPGSGDGDDDNNSGDGTGSGSATGDGSISSENDSDGSSGSGSGSSGDDASGSSGSGDESSGSGTGSSGDGGSGSSGDSSSGNGDGSSGTSSGSGNGSGDDASGLSGSSTGSGSGTSSGDDSSSGTSSGDNAGGASGNQSGSSGSDTTGGSSGDNASGSSGDGSSGNGDGSSGTSSGDDASGSSGNGDGSSGSGSGSSGDGSSGNGDGSSGTSSGTGSGSSGSSSGSGNGSSDDTSGSSGDGDGSESGDSSSENGSGSSGDDNSSSGSGSDDTSTPGNDSGDGGDASGSSPYIVSTEPSKDEFDSVTSALAALPDDGKPYTIYIKAGKYKDQITIARKGKVTIRGQTSFTNDFTRNAVTIDKDGTLTAIYNVDFKNQNADAASTTGSVADFQGRVAVYGCSFIGFQKTLLAHKGTQVFSNSYIEGSADFISGSSTAFFHQTYIAVNTAGGSIAAQSRSSAKASGGFVIDSSIVTLTDSYDGSESTYLGRPMSEYSLVAYMSSYLGKPINPAGWSVWSKSSPRTGHVSFYEYGNIGPGSWSSDRAFFAKELSKSQVKEYALSNWIGGTSWLDMKTYDLAPSYDVTDPTPVTPASGSATSPSSASATWAHPSSGTTPPAGAITVSISGKDGSYRNLTSALNSLPSDDTTQIIFIFSGSYEEQVPTIDRDGAVMIIGHTEEDPGRGYTDNKVTITLSRGLPLPASSGHTDSETATLSTASGKIALYNINVVNTANLDGLESSYATVAGSIFGSHVAFYGCSFFGWQETLLVGSDGGYQYYESSYIEGAIDIISGPATVYFKGCTIGAKKAKSAFTAQSRESSKAGGYIFDQCYFGAAYFTQADLTQAVYLGRPLSEYALVVVKNSYLANVIEPSGWESRPRDDPRTGHVLFGEYKNIGPGNWENNKDIREAVGFGTLLQSDEYSLEKVMNSTDWIDLTYYDSITTPKDGPGSSPADSNGSSPSPSTGSSNSTTPPPGAYVVSKTSIEDTATFISIQDVFDVLTSPDETSVIFIYPGTYEEQFAVDAPGRVIFIGYSESVNDFSANRVTIKHSGGGDIDSDQSISNDATVYATGGQFDAININFVNSNDGEDTALVGFAVKSSTHAGLYGCQGGKDLIIGSGAGYFLNSTISPNEDDVSLTADKRETDSEAAGLVFDQSTITPAPGAGSLSKISLGRPWNSLARVAYVNSYLGSLVKPDGWDQWSSSSPRTGDVLFGEYGNSGPGSDTSDRAEFASHIDNSSVAQFEIDSFFDDTAWIDFSRVAATPFRAGGSTPTTAPSSSSATASSGSETSTTTVQPTTTVTKTVPGTSWVKTIKSITTIFTTSTAAPSTITSTEYVTTTSIKTANVKTSNVTSTVTRTVAGGGTTTHVQPTTSTSKTTSTKTKTESMATTLSCIPARMAKHALKSHFRGAYTSATDSTATDFVTAVPTRTSGRNIKARSAMEEAPPAVASTRTITAPGTTTSCENRYQDGEAPASRYYCDLYQNQDHQGYLDACRDHFDQDEDHHLYSKCLGDRDFCQHLDQDPDGHDDGDDHKNRDYHGEGSYDMRSLISHRRYFFFL
ncbi:Pectinesterase catalytic [Penicillium capsulatum]|nr:Pectinesterase catalytic [Penicillium capsulatum]